MSAADPTSRAFNEIRREADLDEGLDFHPLRRSYVTHMIEDGYDAFFVQQSLISSRQVAGRLLYLAVVKRILRAVSGLRHLGSPGAERVKGEAARGLPASDASTPSPPDVWDSVRITRMSETACDPNTLPCDEPVGKGFRDCLS